MKPLGFEEMIDFGYEDIAAIQLYGSPSHKSNLPSKNGDIKNSFRNVVNKAKARRHFKRKESQKNQKIIRNELLNIERNI